MFAKSQDIKAVGPNELLRLLVAELQPLEDQGIQVNGHIIHIVPVLLLGDNLGLNTNLGLPGFRAHYHCRFCFMIREIMEKACKENPLLLRTEAQYRMCIDAIKNAGVCYGLLFETNLNKLRCFRFYLNYIVDVMHDLFSGIFVYDITELLKKAIESKKCTLKEFNAAKNAFAYGTKEENYLVEDITLKK